MMLVGVDYGSKSKAVRPGGGKGLGSEVGCRVADMPEVTGCFIRRPRQPHVASQDLGRRYFSSRTPAR